MPFLPGCLQDRLSRTNLILRTSKQKSARGYCHPLMKNPRVTGLTNSWVETNFRSRFGTTLFWFWANCNFSSIVFCNPQLWDRFQNNKQSLFPIFCKLKQKQQAKQCKSNTKTECLNAWQQIFILIPKSFKDYWIYALT